MAGTQFLIVLGGGAFLLGLGCVIWMALTKQRGYGIPNWPKVAGRVLNAGVSHLLRETPEGMVSTFTPVIRYEYAVGGVTYTGTRLNFLPQETMTLDSRFEADRLAARYPKDSAVDVFYNAINPKQAALHLPAPVAHNAVLFFGVTNVVMGALVVALGIVLLSR